ncbi:MAG: hypothetical protein WD851_02475 [Pirellulales bacterium]
MAKRKPKKPARGDKFGGKGRPSAGDGVSVRRHPSGKGWLLVHPRAARQRAEDLEEVREMIAAGELEIAVDELRWLLSGCSEFMEAHVLLGQLAIEKDNDLPLARGHYGFAYQLGIQTLQRAGKASPLPYEFPANRPFYEAGRGLAWCLEKIGQTALADEVVKKLQELDLTDPLQVRAMLDDLRSGGLPIVELGL